MFIRLCTNGRDGGFETGELGDLIMCWSKRMSYASPTHMAPWRADPRQGGGFTIETQIHELDFVSWFGGAPEAVRGMVRCDAPHGTGIDVAMSALIAYANGSVGGVSRSPPGAFASVLDLLDGSSQGAPHPPIASTLHQERAAE
jgi:predicted dehydrogenase